MIGSSVMKELSKNVVSNTLIFSSRNSGIYILIFFKYRLNIET